jgi:hypothetical protein
MSSSSLFVWSEQVKGLHARPNDLVLDDVMCCKMVMQYYTLYMIW